MAQRFGLIVSEIELYLFGGVSKLEEEPKTPKSEMIISIVGPLSSLFIGISLLGLFFLPINLPIIISVTLLYSGISNIGLSIFNLLPAFPIDGGRILRAFLWKRKDNLLSATKTASKVGTFFGYCLMIYGFFQILTIGLFNGIWLILIGSFLNSSARQSYLQTKNEFILSNISVRDMFSIPNLQIPFNLTLDVAIREFFIPYKKSYFPVFQRDDIIGIIHIEDIKKIPIQQRSEIIVGYVMRRLSEFQSIDEQQTGKEALKKLNKLNKGPLILIVKENNTKEVLGFIGKTELLSSLEFWSLHANNT
ncbi:MAG: site-2 protease family protein [Promethearchaeota archaeon]|nr:MAG: site-2 protease family protein [Candidatus Lokiarchaeota archaeon]